MRKRFCILLVLVLVLSLTAAAWGAERSILTTATGYTGAADVEYMTVDGTIVNWGARGENATFLTTYAESCYTGDYSWEVLSALSGGTGSSDAYSSDLYEALQDMMETNHTTIQGYQDTRQYYQYTDCVSGDYSQLSTFYSGKMVNGVWDSGVTYNREHIWPRSKCVNQNKKEDSADIMMLRPASPSENSSRGNKAYGESSGFFDPGVDVHGDCARMILYGYVRWGNTGYMWGSDGVMENLDILLEWMEEDPVDTWEMGRNDSVESITGVRNVFVDYPEYAWLLFGREIPEAMVTPSGMAAGENQTLASGTCGDNLTWVLTEDGTLTISGTGDMYDYEAEEPWYAYRWDITAAILEDGVTSIGDRAFYWCSNLESATIADSVTRIGNRAFYACSSLKSADIPDYITSIGEWAFYYCSKLESLTIPNGVTSIGDYAFYYCSSVKTITIPNGVTRIGKSVFYQCRSMESITLGDNVTSIGDSAFYKCNSVKNITIPDSVTSIGNGAFASCSSLESIVIPDSVTGIGEQAFSSCSSLESITIGERVTSIGNNAFSSCSSLKHITVPDSVTGIGEYAFAYCSALESITLGDNVTGIGGFAFYYCSSLRRIVIPDSVTGIGEQAFASCSSLESITIGDGVTSIGYSAFSCCDGLASMTIPDSVTSLGEEVFYSCSNLESVTIGDGVTGIGAYTFYGCSKLGSVKIGNSVASIGNCAFQECRNLTEIYFEGDAPSFGSNPFDAVTATAYYPGSNETWTEDVMQNYGGTITWVSYEPEEDEPNGPAILASGTCGENLTWVLTEDGTLTISGTGDMGDYIDNAPWYDHCLDIVTVIVEDGVTRIGGYAFLGCSNLESATIADSVTSIGRYAFSGCSGLTDITIPDTVTGIGGYAFAGCSGLTRITLPDGETHISEAVFYRCTGLTHITLPDSITSIGDFAFYFCSSLESITIPENVTSIGNSAFSGCSSLTGIWANANNPYFSNDDSGVLFNQNKTELIAAPGTISGTYVIPDSVTGIGAHAFENCYNLTGITIPDSVTIIGDSAFCNCTGLTDITIGNSVIRIADYAFHSCHRLTDVIIPDSVTAIGNAAFGWCFRLTSVTIGSGVTSIGDDVFVECVNLWHVLYTGTEEEWNAISISGSNSQLTSVTRHYNCAGNEIVDGVCTICNPSTNIASGTCGENLTWVLTEDGTLTISGTGDMYDYEWTAPWDGSRSDITTVIIEDGVTSIGSFAFASCSNMENISIPDGVCSIGEAALYNCSSLTSVAIPDSVTSIGGYVFCECSSLTNINIPDGVTSIGDYAFAWCISLTDITIPDSVTSIGNEAFASCIGLGSITIPDSITSIGLYAFRDCSSLTEIYFVGDAPSFDTNTFDAVTATAYYPGSNETWTEDVMQNYGGTITWVSYCIHEWDEGTATLEPTCTEDGVITYICTLCGESYSEVAPATGHQISFSRSEPMEPTCTEEGMIAFWYCGNCCTYFADAELTMPLEDQTGMSLLIPSTGHSYEVTDSKDATCTEEGYVTYTCHCGESYSEVVPATGHNYADGVCVDCGEAEEEPEDPAYVTGDVNGDGRVDYLDAMLIAQYYVSLIGEDDLNVDAADVNGDGRVDYLDAMMVVQFYVRIIDSFPAGN